MTDNTLTSIVIGQWTNALKTPDMSVIKTKQADVYNPINCFNFTTYNWHAERNVEIDLFGIDLPRSFASLYFRGTEGNKRRDETGPDRKDGGPALQ